MQQQRYSLLMSLSCKKFEYYAHYEYNFFNTGTPTGAVAVAVGVCVCVCVRVLSHESLCSFINRHHITPHFSLFARSY